jgi:hypothetical protein
VHHAPEIDVGQPFHLRLVDFVNPHQRHAGIVDDDVEVPAMAASAKASIWVADIDGWVVIARRLGSRRHR